MRDDLREKAVQLFVRVMEVPLSIITVGSVCSSAKRTRWTALHGSTTAVGKTNQMQTAETRTSTSTAHSIHQETLAPMKVSARFLVEQRLECDGHDIDDVKRILVLRVCTL